MFEVNNVLASLKIIESKGFQEQSTETLSDNKWKRVLLAKALEDNNNSNISCIAYGPSMNANSDNAVLKIQGELML